MGRDMATSQDFVTWTCSPLLEPRFLLLCLRAMRNDLIARLAIGSTHKTIYLPHVQGLRIPLPPIDEQRRAVELAYAEMHKIDELSRRVRRQLPLLSERREALITAAVTGQLDRTLFPPT
jgi:type I restriction enzyme S subunit